MYSEKRKQVRVNTYFPTEMTVLDSAERLHDYFAELREEQPNFHNEPPRQLCGYVENVSEGGLGVVTLDSLLSGAKIISKFGPVETIMLTPTVVLAFARCEGYLHHYGFQFFQLTEDERVILKKFIKAMIAAEIDNNLLYV
ncbi:MAG TPA: hypothetical protein DDW65_20290 [Firmicutes bacterium]|jgi:hypothetical protein|nr:hypothetical protein [Bacillota bacterium]